MNVILKRSGWKLPAFLLSAGWLSFLLMANALGRRAVITLADGTLSHDPVLWQQLHAIPLALTLFAGFFLFRKTSRRDLLCSASVAAALSAVFSLLSLTQVFAFAWLSSLMIYWADFLCTYLFKLLPIDWLYMVATWCLPFIFVLFGQKTTEQKTVR